MRKLDRKTLYFTSLGCSKNLVDSQVMLGALKLDGFSIVGEPESAEVIIVNTCSFIQSAREESIETTLDLADYKNSEHGACQLLIMSGCLAQRYHSELEQEMPEVDFFVGTGEYQKIGQIIRAWEEGQADKKSFVEIPRYIHTEFDPRLNTSPKHMAWLKISEGCNRNCTFCIIPSLRGRLRSRSVQSLVAEAERLSSQGVKELNLISQDLSDYGVDLGGRGDLAALLRALEQVEGIEWIRLFYFYPDELSEEVMSIMGESRKICRYLDMPIQHFSSPVLRRMNRKISEEEIHQKIERLRYHVPGIVLRTSLIVGFPGETQEDFETLLNGVQKFEFDHLGVFEYSDEEGTPASRLKGKLEPTVIRERFEQVYAAQREVAERKNKAKLGLTCRVLVEGPHPETELLLMGRTEGQAPDIDGNVIINAGHARAGDFVRVRITEIAGYDVVGEIISSEETPKHDEVSIQSESTV